MFLVNISEIYTLWYWTTAAYQASCFVVLMLSGIGFALWSWPRNQQTHTPWFWCSVMVIPGCVVGAFVLRRFSLFYKLRNRAVSRNTLRNAYVNMVFGVASEPLAVLASGYRVHAEDKENTFDAIVTRSANPSTRPTMDSREMIIASCLDPAAAELAFNDFERQTVILDWILRSFTPAILDALSGVPARLPIAVHLDIDSTVLSRDDITAIWNQLSALVLPGRLSSPPVIEPSGGLWMVDTMLDRTDPAQRDVVTLFLSANLNVIYAADPQPDSTEAACMMLLCPAALARKEKFRVRGWVHRPQEEAAAPSEGALHYALKWGGIRGSAIGGTVQTGFDENTVGRMHLALHAESKSRDGLSHFGLDALLGSTGATAPWLATVLGMDLATTSSSPYLIGVESEGRVLLAVLTPTERVQKLEATGAVNNE